MLFFYTVVRTVCIRIAYSYFYLKHQVPLAKNSSGQPINNLVNYISSFLQFKELLHVVPASDFSTWHPNPYACASPVSMTVALSWL